MQPPAAVVEEHHEVAGEQGDRREDHGDQANKRPARADVPTRRAGDEHAEAHHAGARRLAGCRPERHEVGPGPQDEHDGADGCQQRPDLRRDLEEVQREGDDRDDDDGGEVDDQRVDAEPDGARHEAGVVRRRALRPAGEHVNALGGGRLCPRLGDRVRRGGVAARAVARRRGDHDRQLVAGRRALAGPGHGPAAGAGGAGSTRARRRSSRRAMRSAIASARRVRWLTSSATSSANPRLCCVIASVTAGL